MDTTKFRTLFTAVDDERFGLALRWRAVEWCGDPTCPCRRDPTVAVFGGERDRWVGVARCALSEVDETIDAALPDFDVAERTRQVAVLIGVAWSTVEIAPLAAQERQVRAARALPDFVFKQSVAETRALRRWINETDPLAVAMLLMSVDYGRGQ